jgi:hypothetical protein
MKSDYPCWLSQRDLFVAQSLIQADFIYCGKSEDLVCYDPEIGTGFNLGNCCGWKLASAYGEVALEAIRDGAVFGKCLELLPNVNFEREIRITRKIIKEAIKEWELKSPQAIQLSLFE